MENDDGKQEVGDVEPHTHGVRGVCVWSLGCERCLQELSEAWKILILDDEFKY